jgi:hypothetical protein
MADAYGVQMRGGQLIRLKYATLLELAEQGE